MRNPHWAWRPLGELFEIGAGKTMSARARDGEHQMPFLRTSNVFWDEIDVSSVDTMSLSSPEIQEKSLRLGDLLVCEGGDIGRSAVWAGEIKGPVSFQNHLHRLRPATNEVDPRFYVYFLQAAFTQLGLFEGSGNKTTIPNLSRNRLAALEVPSPDIGEQIAVVSVLGEARRAIKTNEALTAKTAELKTNVLTELFTRGLRGEAQKESEVGPIPETWNCVPFAEIREWLQYGTSVRCTPELAQYPVLRIPNIASGHVDDGNLKYCDMASRDAANYLLENGDLLFIRTNGVLDRLGSCAIYDGKPKKSLFASYLIRARMKPAMVPRFAAYFLGSETGTQLVAGRATPAADGKYNLNTGTIDSLPVPLPPTQEEQNEIVDVLAAIDQKLELHKNKRLVLDALFKSLLHKLMTGEIRVSDLDLSALDAMAPTEVPA